MPNFIGKIPYPILSRYSIEPTKESLLGSGGMGAVFRARDRLLDAYVAIKTILPIWVDNAADRQLFS